MDPQSANQGRTILNTLLSLMGALKQVRVQWGACSGKGAPGNAPGGGHTWVCMRATR